MDKLDKEAALPADLMRLYEEDPERADLEVFGRRTGKDRRGFLKGAGLATMGTYLMTSRPKM